MRVKLARVAGFCMGVRRAMEIALEASRTAPKPVYTLGPLIHNPSALALLEKQGVSILKDIPEKGEGTVIIRAHGTPPSTIEKLKRAGFYIKNATCPKVVKVQMLAKTYTAKGYYCVLIGDEGHAEVIGILAHAGDKGLLVSSEEDIEKLPKLDKYIILAQTTQDRKRFERWCQKILEKNPGGKIFDTICDATFRRQHEVRRLAKHVEAMVVVGGKSSANTQRLAKIAKECNTFTLAVETADDLDLEKLKNFSSIGVTAGASTPNWVINQVVKQLEALPGKRETILERGTKQLIRFLLEANLMTGFAGFCLTFGIGMILGLGLRSIIAAVAAGSYIYVMHTLNRLLNREAGRYNDPLRANFLTTHQKALIGFSILLSIVSILASFYLGRNAFLIYLALFLLGALYTARLLTNKRINKKIMVLSGTKSFLVPLAWSIVSVIAPTIDINKFDPKLIMLLFLLSFAIVFLRSALLDVLEIHGDKIVGKETIAVILGESKTITLIKFVASLIAITSLLLVIFKLTPIGVICFLPISLIFLLLSFKLKGEAIGLLLRLELFVELNFILFALLISTLKLLSLRLNFKV